MNLVSMADESVIGKKELLHMIIFTAAAASLEIFPDQ